MLPSESLRTISVVNGSQSNHRSGEVTMENRECSFVASAAKYKKRKVSAVRDFPPGCGRFAQQVNSRPTEEINAACTNLQSSNCKEGNSDGIKDGASNLAMGLDQVGVATSMEEISPVLLDDDRLLPTETNDTVRSDTLLNVNHGTSDLANDLLKVGGATPKEEMGPVLLDGNFLLPTEKTDTACIDTLPNSNSNEGSSDGLKNGTPDLAKDLHQVGVATPKEELGPVRLDDNFPLPPNGPSSVSNGNGLKKIVARKYPPRRRVSAIRDFPPFCGMNAPSLSKKEPLEVLAPLENINSGQEKSVPGMNDRELAETVKQTVGTVGDAQDGDLFSSELEMKGSEVNRDTVQPKDSLDILEPVKNKSFDREESGPEMDEKSLTEIVNVALKGSGYEVRPDQTKSSIEEKRKKGEPVKSSERMVEQEERGICSESPFEDKLYWWDHEFETVRKDDGNVEGSEENLCQEIVVYSEDKSANEMLSVASENQLQATDLYSFGVASDRVMVQGLMAASQCPWRQGKSAFMSEPAAGMSGSKGKKLDYISRVEIPKTKSVARKKVDGSDLKRKSLKNISLEAACQGAGQLVIWDKENSRKRKECDLRGAPILRAVHVDVPPLYHGTSSVNHDASITRNKVRETLRLFQAVFRKLLQEEEAKSKQEKQGHKRVDYQAAKILKDKNKYVNTGKQILGAVSGVEVGDEFQYRVELNMIGLHRQIQGGIDYVKHGSKILATSIVASGGYSDDLDNSDVLVYTGQGGNVMNSDKEPEDQKLERGNLALKNSMHEKNPVRVIRGSESSDGRSRTYVYDGLYLVVKLWQELGPHGKLVFKFQLERIPGQPELAWKEVKKSKKFKVREGVCVDDISGGKEKIPICAVNTINDEKPPHFKYVMSLIYPDWYRLTPPKGCNCISGCSDSEKCSCAVKNGGEIPFNFNGAIVQAKSLVYECGPSCKCPPSCYNRVSQHGIKFQLEIFKTNLRGWGVRSLNFIPSGSFICEYIGELLKEKEAEERTGNDEYLFDIGNNYNDNSLWNGLSILMPDVHSTSCGVVEDGGFTIDAAEYGNIGRFVNHSCTPNLYAQNVLYDHEDKRIPHIMLFAAENIPPLQELTYHYNYSLDEVRDLNGNIKKKSCFCGSPDCTGRLY
ncbi:histone H3-K9 methyltransferase [Parasponia andersonii]|uniref:Histone H3-K9 methyltransferase n=1 Tax=Parasponia andersonii TaxID=3476 RepID=A0A2P5CU90_PARAD|nr:histone H3-K9 methyltransferase [Parasponia andersonii]